MTLATIDGKKLAEMLGGGRGDLLALFTARWCGYCRRLREELAESKLGVRVVEVDVSDEEDPAWDDWKVELVPTAVLFRAGAEIGRKPPASIRGLSVDEIKEFLAAAPPKA